LNNPFPWINVLIKLRAKIRFPDSGLELQWARICLLLLMFVSGPASAADTPAQPAPSLLTVEVRGRIVCLSEEMRQSYGANVPEKHAHDYGLKANDGKYYSLVRTASSEALLTDTNLLSRTLILKGRVFPKTQLLEVVGNVHTVRDGKVYELFYYCDICAIKSSIPGPCMCCREPVHLVEESVK